MMPKEDKPFHARHGMPWKYRFYVTRVERYCVEIFDDEVKDWPIPDADILARLREQKPQTTYNIKYSGPALLSSDVESWEKEKKVRR